MHLLKSYQGILFNAEQAFLKLSNQMNNLDLIFNETKKELKNSFDKLTNENLALKKEQKDEFSNLKGQFSSIINLSIGEIKKDHKDNYISFETQISELKNGMKFSETTTGRTTMKTSLFSVQTINDRSYIIQSIYVVA